MLHFLLQQTAKSKNLKSRNADTHKTQFTTKVTSGSHGGSLLRCDTIQCDTQVTHFYTFFPVTLLLLPHYRTANASHWFAHSPLTILLSLPLPPIQSISYPEDGGSRFLQNGGTCNIH